MAPQLELAEQIANEFQWGKQVVILDAPTGTGKTLIAELVRRVMETRALYLCTTKTLQDQFAHDFPYAKILKGRVNYPTADNPSLYPNISARDCDKQAGAACDRCDPEAESDEDELHCSWCHPWFRCPYEKAKTAALNAQLAASNVAYFLTEANGPGKFTGQGLVVIDEADRLENELMTYAELRITPRRRAQLGLEPPARKTIEAAQKAGAWSDWCRYAAGVVREARDRLAGERGERDVHAMREHAFLTQLLRQLRKLETEIEDGNWIYSDYDSQAIVFKPVRVSEMAPETLWKHGDHFLLMSATVISPEEMATSLGVEEWAHVSASSSFPKENRPVYVTPVANVTHKTKATAHPLLVDAVQQIIESHDDDRILVHAVSYELAKILADNIRTGRELLSYSGPNERSAAIETFRATPSAILIAPSLDRGVDLPYDACRCTVIAKVPYPHLGDKQVSARFHGPGGEVWFRVQAIRTLVQMCGRGVRAADDTCDTYILDEQFLRLWRQSRVLFPSWFREAVRTNGGLKVQLRARKERASA